MKIFWYIIDGYSVLHRTSSEGFGSREDLANGRRALVDQIAGVLPSRELRVTMVFDGQCSSEERAEFGSRLELVFTGGHQTADAYIERLAGRLAHPENTVVVSSDRAVVETVAAARCQVMTARAFLEQLGDTQQKYRRQMKRSSARPPKRPKLGDYFPEGW